MITKEERQRLVKAIEEAEVDSSGEIRIHFERKCSDDPIVRAAEIFDRLKMGETELKNGVLFYVALKDKKFAILGDSGIDERVPEGFWNNIKEGMIQLLKKDDIVGAIERGVKMAGQQLGAHFPYQTDDVNELSNEISFGD